MRDAPNPNLPEAVCCKVDVVKGGNGFLLNIFEFTSETLNLDLFIILIALTISSLFLNENFSTLSPLNKLNFEKIFLLSLFVKLDARVQYSSGLNYSISFSLSVISFKATD